MIDGLPESRRSRVFTRICQQLMTDPVLKAVVKTWDTWDGDADHSADVIGLDPMVRLTPQLGPVGWYSPDSQAGPLEIAIEVGINSFEARDCLDLWEAIENAIYPADPAVRNAFEADLRDYENIGCSAKTGQIEFSRPASIQGAANGQFKLLGMMSIDIIRPFNP